MTSNRCSPFLARFTEGYICASIVEIGVSLLESKKEYETAIYHLFALLNSPYRIGKRGYYWNRLALNLEHMGRMDEAISVCEQSLSDPHVRLADRLSLERRLDRLCKPPRRWRKPEHLYQLLPKVKKPHEVWIKGIQLPQPVGENATGKKNRWLGFTGFPCSVESLALQYYELKEDWKGSHCEGSVFVTLFSLLFWDIIFADVPHVFQTPYQDSPLDMGTDAFYPSRQSRIDERLEKIQVNRDGYLERLLLLSWRFKGTQCRGVNWGRNTFPELVTIANCVGGNSLCSIFSAFAKDYRKYTAGMPDLLLWNVEKQAAKFVEVKGPNDKLSDRQKIWIDILSTSGTNVEVCHVKALKTQTKSHYSDVDLQTIFGDVKL